MNLGIKNQSWFLKPKAICPDQFLLSMKHFAIVFLFKTLMQWRFCCKVQLAHDNQNNIFYQESQMHRQVSKWCCLMVTFVDFVPYFSRILNIIWDQYASDRVDEIFDPESQWFVICFDIGCEGSIISSYVHFIQMDIMENAH